MSAATETFDEGRVSAGDAATRFLRDNAWTVGLLILLVALLAFTRFIQPTYGPPGVQGLAIAVLPLALATVGQAIVVISGGIDLSLGSIIAFITVVAATLMKAYPELSILVVLGVLLLGMLVGAVNGGLIVITRVPDIVVTLAMSFVWAGAALLVLKTPGGAAADWLKELLKGNVLIEWVPRAAVLLIVIVAVIWIPLRRSRLGLSFYAIGSNQLAAFRSGVSVGRTKIASYAFLGLFAALAALSITANTGQGSPSVGQYTLQSVAAIVLGGVSLAGGRGGVFGAIVAVIILQLIRADMAFLNVNSNLATVANGVILIGVVMFGSLLQIRRERAR
jgi:ribose transport system permease protein